jgi:hypothetical protein
MEVVVGDVEEEDVEEEDVEEEDVGVVGVGVKWHTAYSNADSNCYCKCQMYCLKCKMYEVKYVVLAEILLKVALNTIN